MAAIDIVYTAGRSGKTPDWVAFHTLRAKEIQREIDALRSGPYRAEKMEDLQTQLERNKLNLSASLAWREKGYGISAAAAGVTR